MTLFFRAADELAKIVHAVYDRLDIPVGTHVNVSHSGGMFSERELLLEPFLANLSRDPRRYRVVPPRLPPVAGAALYAAKLSGAPLSTPAIRRLEVDLVQGAEPRLGRLASLSFLTLSGITFVACPQPAQLSFFDQSMENSHDSRNLCGPVGTGAACRRCDGRFSSGAADSDGAELVLKNVRSRRRFWATPFVFNLVTKFTRVES